MNDYGRKLAAKLYLLEWRNICLRYGSQAAINFVTIYGKYGPKNAYEYLRLLNECDDDTEKLNKLIQEVSAKVKELFGGQNERPND